MVRQVLIGMAAALLVGLAAAPEVQAWGAYHAGYTHVGYGGVQHYGTTAVAGPRGVYDTGHYGDDGGAAAGGYHYGTTAYGGAYGAAAGAYRRW
jgi:hypothetical protein